MTEYEAAAPQMVNRDWMKTVDQQLIDDLGKYRKYNGAAARDLLRVIRNKVKRWNQGTLTSIFF